MKKKVTAILLALSMMAGALAGCGETKEATSAGTADTKEANTAETSDAYVHLTFMGWGSDSEIAAYNKMIEQFEEEYPGTDVEFIVVADNEFDTKLQTMIGAGQCPDVFYCPIDSLMKYASTGNLLSLTDFVANNEVFDANNIWDCAIDLYRFDGENQGKGEIYALPKDVSVFPIFYNVDLFNEAGITAPTEEDPWDWNDFLEAAKALTKGEGDEKVYGTGAYSLESAVWSNGAEWVDQETLSQVLIDDPAFEEALQWCADLMNVYHVAPTTEERTALSDYDRFKQGKLAMVGAGTWSLNDFWTNCDFEWDVMNWPVSPKTGKSEIWFGSAGIGVSSVSEHPAEASNLAAYLAFNENAQRTAYTMGQAVPMLKDMAYGEFMTMDKAPAHKEVLFNILENNARLATQSRTFNQEWFAEFNSNTAAVYNAEMTAKEYCESIKDTVQQLLDESIEQKHEYVGN